ncbi:TPA: hypothetical protein ACGO1E_001783 [Streptococcus suis]
MKITINKSLFIEVVQLASFLVFLVLSILNISLYKVYFSRFFSIISLVTIVICIVGELLKKYNFKSIIGLVSTIVLFIISVKVSSGSMQLTLPISFLFIFCLRNKDFYSIARNSFFLSLVTLIFIIVSSKIGIIQDFVFMNNGRERHFLGFTYALYPSTIMANITVLYAIIAQRKSKIINIFILLVMNYWIYSQTDSRFTFAASVLVIFIIIILKYYPNFFEKIKILLFPLIFSFIIAFGISFYLSKNYDSTSNWQNSLNNLFSGRLILGHRSLSKYGYNWFGQVVNWTGNAIDSVGRRSTGTYDYVDSMYLQILQRYGVFFTTAVLSILSITCAKLYKKKEYLLLFMMIITAFHGIIDDLNLYIFYNSLWFITALTFNDDYELRSGE